MNFEDLGLSSGAHSRILMNFEDLGFVQTVLWWSVGGAIESWLVSCIIVKLLSRTESFSDVFHGMKLQTPLRKDLGERGYVDHAFKVRLPIGFQIGSESF